MIINAENLILGRVAALAAKQSLIGEEVSIVNCEKAVITGNKKSIIKHYLSRLRLGQPQQGPFVHRRPDMFVRRTIRGMLPRKQPKGRAALARVKCYLGTPSNLEGKSTKPKEAISSNIRKARITVGELCMHLGAKR